MKSLISEIIIYKEIINFTNIDIFYLQLLENILKRLISCKMSILHHDIKRMFPKGVLIQ